MQEYQKEVTAYGTQRGDFGHRSPRESPSRHSKGGVKSHHSESQTIERSAPAKREMRRVLFGNLEFIAAHFPLDSNEEIEMHAFSSKPSFQVFAGIRAKFNKHFSFEHIDEDALRVS